MKFLSLICNSNSGKKTNNAMKRLFSNISPYLLLLIPIFFSLAILLIHADATYIQEDTTLNASFIRITDFNIIQVISSIF